MSNLRTQAESIAIENGLLDVTDAVTWADHQIEKCEIPDVALCDVAMASSKFQQDVARMLRSLPGEIDNEFAVQATLRIALREIKRGVRDQSDIAHILFDFAFRDILPEGNFKTAAYGFWDAIDLARNGIGVETESEVVNCMA